MLICDVSINNGKLRMMFHVSVICLTLVTTKRLKQGLATPTAIYM